MMHGEWLNGPGRAYTRFGKTPQFKEGLYKIGDHTYAWMVPNGSWGESNTGLIDCNGASVLVDTCWDLPYTTEMVDASRSILQASPIQYLINTHSDGDHFWGNQLFKDKEIIASHKCIERMHHLKPISLTALKTMGRLLAHVPMFHLNTFGRYMHEMVRPYNFKGVALTPATHGFSDEKRLTVNDVEIHIEEAGPAHTDGDAIVYLPDEDILFAGDLLFLNSTPVVWAGPAETWIAGLKKIMAKKPKIIVPGHGPVTDCTGVQLVIDYLEMIHEALETCCKKGLKPEEAGEAIIFGTAFQSSPFACWDSPERIVTSAHTLYRHWGAYKSGLPEVVETLTIMRKQAILAKKIARVR